MSTPFDLANDSDYRAWRAAKLANYPRRVDDLIVPIDDPRTLKPAEIQALQACCARANMVLYHAPDVPADDKNVPHRFATQLGLVHLEGNYLADEDGLSSITPAGDEDGGRGEYVPYTHKPINWHTDGYYNAPDRRILGMLLHCVQDADSGGENALLDPDIAYIQLRDTNPQYVAALMQPDAMTIPARMDEAPTLTLPPHPTPDGTTNHSTKPASGQVAAYPPQALKDSDSLRAEARAKSYAGEGANVMPKPVDGRGQTPSPNQLIARAEQSGPVFSVDANEGFMHMRYTARTRSIGWKPDALTQAAVNTLAEILNDSEYVLRARLRPGMGLICNNVLHTRTAFVDRPERRRLLYRGRYYDRLNFAADQPSG